MIYDLDPWHAFLPQNLDRRGQRPTSAIALLSGSWLLISASVAGLLGLKGLGHSNFEAA
jgi:hypothetical protein